MSNDAPLNPYAPPVSVEPLAAVDAGKLWMVHGDHLLVRDGARLPPVSLFGEDEGGELTSSHQVFVAASGASAFGLLVPLVIAIAVIFSVANVVPRLAGLAGLLAFLVSGRLFRRFTKASQLIANIHCYLPIARLKARARRDRWRSGMIMAALVGVVVTGLSDSFISGNYEREHLWDDWFKTPVVLGTVGLFLAAMVWLMAERWLRCVRQTGGWFYLTGVPASSLLKLSRISPEPPPLRTRKVYTLYQYRLPLGILLGPRRNPLLILIVALFKVFRSRALVRQNFHWSERRRGLPSGEGMAKEIEKLRSEGEFASWQELGCIRVGSPKGDLSMLTARFASPDRRHFCHLTLYRISKARAFVEVAQTDFRTWTTDGRCVITSDQPFYPRLPEYLDLQRVRGNVSGQWSRHLQRCERVTPLAVESEEELRALLEKEAEDHAVLLQEAGIRSANEEVEMPGDWEV
ncbi:hypothetical protein [Luteolibacter soli]|uniref:Uncharacterized protein n=1 Tax=Luteolibacter soli TaxID=3135280 RepID=A0ABU9AWN6_9BACT